MKVRVLQGFVGNDGLTYLEGLSYDFPEARAASLIKSGRATAVVSRKIKVKAPKTKARAVAVINKRKMR